MTLQISDLAPTPAGGVGQATTVETGRAMAEVLAMFRLAADRPRDLTVTRATLARVIPALVRAGKARYAYAQQGETVTGLTVHVAKAVAHAYGNLQFAVDELSRDSGRHQSEIRAYAVDLETTVRSHRTFITPHVRSKRRPGRGQGKDLILLDDPRDVYLSNNNTGARALREVLWDLLPFDLIADVEDMVAMAERQHAGTDPNDRRTKLVEWIRQHPKLGTAFLTAAIDKHGPVDTWSDDLVLDLRTVAQSIVTGELTLTAYVEPDAPTDADLARQTDTSECPDCEVLGEPCTEHR